MAHNKRCPFCDTEIRWEDVESEHVIPRHLKTDQSALLHLLHELGLPATYNLDSFDNLLPAHRRCNRQKSGRVHPVAALLHYRSLASDKLGQVQELLKKFTDEKFTDEKLASVAGFVAKRVLSAEEVYNSLTQVHASFLETYLLDTDPVQLSKARVLIHCELPKESSPTGKMTITFRHVELRSVQLRVEHAEILRTLFNGFSAPFGKSPRCREFIERWDESAKRFLLRFNGIALSLSEDETQELCELLSRIAPVYLEAYRNMEERIDSAGFELLQPGVYRLMKVPRPLFEAMIKFANLHDLAKGESQWHIFDWNSGSIKIIERTSKHWRYCAFVEPESYFTDPWGSGVDEKVWLCWNVEDHEMLRGNEINNEAWTPKRTLAFLEELIPVVVEWTKTNCPLPPETLTQFEKLQRYRNEENRSFQVKLDDFATGNSGERRFEKMQSFYNRIPRDAVSPSVIVAVIEIILQLMERFPLHEHINYFNEKLGTPYDKTPTPQSVRARREALLAEPVLTGSDADHCLRALCCLVRGIPDKQKEQAIFNDCKKHIEVLLNHYNTSRYLDRLQCWPHMLAH